MNPMRYLPLLLLCAMPALAADYATVTVLDTATDVTSTLTHEAGSYRTFLIENGGGAAIYCSKDPSVTTDTGHKVGANDGFRSFPNDGPLYCIAAASQSGTGRAHAIVWGSYQ